MPLNTSAIVSCVRACVLGETERDRHRMEVDLFLCTCVLNASALRSLKRGADKKFIINIRNSAMEDKLVWQDK